MRSIIIIFSVMINMPINAQLNLVAWEKSNYDYQNKETVSFAVVDSALYTISTLGVWKKQKSKDLWELEIPIGQVSSFIKVNKKYYIGLYSGGIMESQDLTKWKQVDSTFAFQVFNLIPFGNRVYACTNKGLYKFDEMSGRIIKEILVNENIHNQLITELAVTETKLFAFACNYIFVKENSEDTWAKLDFTHNFCVSDVLVINEKIYFSSTGDGIYVINDANSLPDKISTRHIHPNVQKLCMINDKMVKLHHGLLYEEEEAPFSLENDYISDVIIFENIIYISTLNEGIFKAPANLENRNINEPTLEIFPNPSSGMVNYCLDNLNSSQFEISILNMDGKTLIRKNITNLLNENRYVGFEKIEFDGVFILVCKIEGKSFIRKFTVIK